MRLALHVVPRASCWCPCRRADRDAHRRQRFQTRLCATMIAHMMAIIMMMMMMRRSRNNNKKGAEAGVQVKQAASRCDAIKVALMNDLLLGAIATSLATTVTLPPAEETPLPILSRFPGCSQVIRVLGWAAGICLAAALESFGSCRRGRWLGTRWAEYPGTAWLPERSGYTTYVGYMSASSACRYVL